MSNNEKMVSVPRDVIEFAVGFKTHGYKNRTEQHNDQRHAQDKLRALLAQPVEQHQGEPVWYMTENGLSATHAKMKALSDRQGWDTSDYSVPLYTHADPNVRWKAVADEQMGVIQALRAQLAERDALLSEAWEYDIGTPLKRKIKAALSASAEPSAPVERDERAEFEAYCAAIGLPIDRLPSGEYLIPAARFAYQGWHARAALERKP